MNPGSLYRLALPREGSKAVVLHIAPSGIAMIGELQEMHSEVEEAFTSKLSHLFPLIVVGTESASPCAMSGVRAGKCLWP